jgi:hypothetical protein
VKDSQWWTGFRCLWILFSLWGRLEAQACLRYRRQIKPRRISQPAFKPSRAVKPKFPPQSHFWLHPFVLQPNCTSFLATQAVLFPTLHTQCHFCPICLNHRLWKSEWQRTRETHSQAGQGLYLCPTKGAGKINEPTLIYCILLFVGT